MSAAWRGGWKKRVRAKEREWVEQGYCRECGEPPRPDQEKTSTHLCDACKLTHRRHQQAYRWRKLLA